MQRRDGRWWARMSIDGKRKVFYGKTREEAHAKLVAAQSDHRKGLPIILEQLTVGTYLTGWLEAARLSTRHYSTWKRKNELLRLHVIPTLGRIRSPSSRPSKGRRSTPAGATKGCR
jgi:hypothetical protein